MSISKRRLIPQAIVAVDNRFSKEVMAFCQSCKAFEAIWFSIGILNQTRKFMQSGNHVYHDCGSNEPCRLHINI